MPHIITASSREDAARVISRTPRSALQVAGHLQPFLSRYVGPQRLLNALGNRVVAPAALCTLRFLSIALHGTRGGCSRMSSRLRTTTSMVFALHAPPGLTFRGTRPRWAKLQRPCRCDLVVNRGTRVFASDASPWTRRACGLPGPRPARVIVPSRSFERTYGARAIIGEPHAATRARCELGVEVSENVPNQARRACAARSLCPVVRRIDSRVRQYFLSRGGYRSAVTPVWA